MRDRDTVEVEVVTPESNGALARYEPEDPSGPTAQVRAAASALQLQWEREKTERAKWTEEDLRVQTRMRIAAMVAGSMISEGGMGAYKRADQIADHAVEVADAVLIKLETKPIPPRPRRP